MSTSSNYLFVVCALVAFVFGQPQQFQNLDLSSKLAKIVHQVVITNSDNSYQNSYETSNGIKVENSGHLKSVLVPHEVDKYGNIIQEHEAVVLVQTGSYSYVDPEGNIVYLKYIADENGFQPQAELTITDSQHLSSQPEPQLTEKK